MDLAILKPFGAEIWIADGPEVSAYAGFHYPTRMAVIRLSNGDLFIWSPVPLTHDLRGEIAALGPPRHIVAPNTLHHLSLPDWAQAFPAAKIYAAPGLREKRKDIAFDGDLGDQPMDAWTGEIDQAVMAGNIITTEIIFFHVKSGTALFTDLLQQFPPHWFSGWRGIVAKLDLMVGSEPSVPRKFRVAFTNRRAARAAMARLLAWPIERVVMAHGTPVTADGKALVARAFRWLKP